VKPRLFYGWWIVATGLIIVVCGSLSGEFLSSQLPGLLKEHFRSSAVTLGTTFSIYGLSGSIALLVIGPLIDRYGPRKLMLAGIPMAGIGFVLLSFADSIVTLNIILGALLGIGIKAGFLLPVQTATANWFIRRRSLALALVMTASVIGEAIVTLSGEQVAGQLDWRATFIWLGVGILVIGTPLAFVIKHRPEQYDKLPDGNTSVSDGEGETETDSTIEVNFTLWQALKTRAFWLLAIAPTLSLATVNMVRINQFIYLQQESGFGRATVTDIIQLIPLMGVAGILIFGYMGDRFPKRYLLAAAVFIQSASILLLMAAGNVFHLYFYAFVFGLGSGTVPLLWL